MVEDAFTTKKKIRLTTVSPNVKKRTKKSPNGNKLITTQVHVTNEYEPITQATVLSANNRVQSSESSSSEEYYEEDLLYYDEDDDEESDEEYSVESPPVRSKPEKIKPVIIKPVQVKSTSANPINVHENSLKRKRRRPSKPSDYDSYEYYEDEDEEDEEEDEDFSLENTFKYGSPVRGSVFDYFGDVISRFGRFITTLMGFTGRRRRKGYSEESIVVASTTPRTRRPKRPAQNYYEFHDLYGYSDEIKVNNDLEKKEESSTVDSEKGMWSGLGTWFGGDDSSSTGPPELSTKENSWFFNIFTSTTTPTTTTEKTESTSLNPLDPGNFIALLAQHLVSTEAPEKIPEDNLGQNPGKKVDYSNFQLWRLRPSDSWQVRFLTNLRASSDCEKCQWWKGPSLRGPTDLVIPPESLSFFEETLHNQGIMFEVVISDLQKAITYSNPRMTRREQYEIEVAQGHPVTFYRYHRFDDIVKFLEFLQRKYPENVELSHFGRSFEGLPLIMAKIFSPGNGTMELRTERGHKKRLVERKYLKPVILIEAGSHGREWIAPAVAMWILNTLAQGIGKNDPQSEIYRSVDWLVVPVLNPDGYEYTHTHDRLWRKTRSTARPEKSGFLSVLPFWNWFQGNTDEESANCTGVDLNRNWNYEWTKKGITGKPCGDLYSGPKAFSEPESNALQNFAMKHRKRITVFISLHSYGQMISIPKEIRGRNEDLIDMAHVAAQALNGHSSLNRYLVDDTGEMLFPRPGASDAFMLNTVGAQYSYTLELRDTGTHGFLLPPSYIEATARDAFDVIKAIIDNL
uniref:Peptidase M14 domain-containing protein n=1 Tax=Phlebotomus papatasi TaxID=29031 RepID=A0A1B0DLT4_PHLPP